MAFLRTTAANLIIKMTKRIKVIQGGTSAGKTYCIIPILISKAIKTPNLKITIVAETIPAVKDGAVDIFKSIMQELNRWENDCWIGNPMEYTFRNGSRIQFKAFDSEGKAKASGKRDILFINEANHISFIIADALMIRSKETYIDFNPNERFWVHDEVLTESNAEFLLLTYEQNEGLPAETLEDLLIKKGKAFINPNLEGEKLLKSNNIKSPFWCNWWRVYGLGLVGSLEGVIFSNWQQIANIPDDARLISHGLDFGYTNDPTACTSVYMYNGKLILHENFYQKGLLNSDIKDLINSNNISKSKPIYADSAEPKSIAELTMSGIYTKPAIKGTDSIKFGIDYLQQYELLVTSTSTNLIKELRNYQWDKDKDGKTLNKPIDAFNHAIDSVRYAVCELSMPQRLRYTA